MYKTLILVSVLLCSCNNQKKLDKELYKDEITKRNDSLRNEINSLTLDEINKRISDLEIDLEMQTKALETSIKIFKNENSTPVIGWKKSVDITSNELKLLKNSNQYRDSI